MIHEPVLFVLGAGASVPVGFPTGSQLRDSIISDLTRTDSQLRKILQVKYHETLIEAFRESLRDSAVDTIDQFLENNPQQLEIGRMAIACRIASCEDTSRLSDRSNGNWYPLLAQQMHGPPADLRSNQIAFVTFNYDRSLEQFLFAAIKNRYNMAEDDAASIVNSYSILHMYGKLGALPWEEPSSNEPQGPHRRPYGATPTPEAVASCVECFRIPHDPALAKKQHAHLSLVIRNYREIHFLGFGYDELNLSRVITRGDYTLSSLHGSAFGLGERAMRRIESDHNIRLDRKRQPALEYLKNVVGWD